MGYCMGAHYGNQRSNVEGSFEEWGVAEAMKNHIQTWELGGFKYKQDPLKYFSIKGAMVEESSSDPYGINKAYKDASIVRPMTNALVLKNDEAGIDGVGILCSNRPLDIPEAELVKVKDVTTNMCGQGKTVCSCENVTTAGTGIVADGAVVQSAMVIEQGLTGKCAIRELRHDECNNFVVQANRAKEEEDETLSFSAISDANRPKGCFVEVARSISIRRGTKTLPAKNSARSSSNGTRFSVVPTASSAARETSRSVNFLPRPSKQKQT